MSTGKLAVALNDARVDEVKFKRDSVRIDFFARTDDGFDEMSVERSLDPHPDFTAARRALENHLLELCEIPASGEHNITINGVAFKWKDGVMGAVIKGQRSYVSSHGTLTMNSPVKYQDHNTPEKIMGETLEEVLDVFHDEALEYVGGKSQQMEMEFEAGDEEFAEA